LARAAVAVAFEQPVFVVVGGELADAGAELLERVEAFDPQHLLLERLDELLDDAVGFGLVWKAGLRSMWSYPIIKDGLIYVVDLSNGLYAVRYRGPFEREVRRISFLEGNSTRAMRSASSRSARRRTTASTETPVHAMGAGRRAGDGTAPQRRR